MGEFSRLLESEKGRKEMRKLELVAAMLAMVLVAAVPAFAQQQEGAGQEGEEDCILLSYPAQPCPPQEAGGAEPVGATTPEEVGAEPVGATTPEERTVPNQDAPAEEKASGSGGGATSEEFVCFRSTPNKVKLGTGKVVTTPSGNVNVVCTGQAFNR